MDQQALTKALARLKQEPPLAGFEMRLERALVQAAVPTAPPASADAALISALGRLKQSPPGFGFDARLAQALALAAEDVGAGSTALPVSPAEVAVVGALASLRQSPPDNGFEQRLGDALASAAMDLSADVAVGQQAITSSAVVTAAPLLSAKQGAASVVRPAIWQRPVTYAAAAAALLVVGGGVFAALQPTEAPPMTSAEPLIPTASAQEEQVPAVEPSEPPVLSQPPPVTRLAPQTRSSKGEAQLRGERLIRLKASERALQTSSERVTRSRVTLMQDTRKSGDELNGERRMNDVGEVRELPRLRLRTEQLDVPERGVDPIAPSEVLGPRLGQRERLRQRVDAPRQEVSESPARRRVRPRARQRQRTGAAERQNQAAPRERVRSPDRRRPRRNRN